MKSTFNKLVVLILFAGLLIEPSAGASFTPPKRDLQRVLVVANLPTRNYEIRFQNQAMIPFLRTLFRPGFRRLNAVPMTRQVSHIIRENEFTVTAELLPFKNDISEKKLALYADLVNRGHINATIIGERPPRYLPQPPFQQIALLSDSFQVFLRSVLRPMPSVYPKGYIPNGWDLFNDRLPCVVSPRWWAETFASRFEPLQFISRMPVPVLTIAANFRTRRGIRRRIERAAASGARGVMVVSGDHPWVTVLQRMPLVKYFMLDSIKVLRLIQEMRPQLPMDFEVWAVADPNAASTWASIEKLAEKVDAGATAILTQPPLAPHRFKEWLMLAERNGLSSRVKILVSIPIIGSLREFDLWLALAGLRRRDPDVISLRGQFANAEAEGRGKEFGLQWARERLVEMRATPGVAGAHLIPLAHWQSLPALFEVGNPDNVIPNPANTSKASVDASLSEPGDSWLQKFESIRTSLLNRSTNQDSNDARLVQEHDRDGAIAIVAYLLERFPQHEAAIFNALLVPVPTSSPDMQFGLPISQTPTPFEIWELRPNLRGTSRPEPDWHVVVTDRFNKEVDQPQQRTKATKVREHQAHYFLRSSDAVTSSHRQLTLVSSRLVEHDIHVYPESFKGISPITEDIHSRSVRPLDNEGAMLSYIEWLREFRRQRAVYLRLARRDYYRTDDAVVRMMDEASNMAKDWLYRQPVPQKGFGERLCWPIKGPALEVLRFLIGWGYIEKEAHDVNPGSREQIENYRLFVGADGRFYVGKGFRRRGHQNVNAYPKERLGSRLGAVCNYAQIIQPSEAEAPELYEIDQFGFTWISPDVKKALDKPYLSDITLNTEREYNGDPASHPSLITNLRILRSWLLVMDVWLRNVDPKFTNLSLIEVNVPGIGRVQLPMKIDADFQMHPGTFNISRPSEGNSFEQQYMEQKLRYWAFDPEAFDASAYDLPAMRAAIRYVQERDVDAIFTEEPGLLEWRLDTGSYVFREVLDGVQMREFVLTSRKTIEPDVRRIFALLTGQDRPLDLDLMKVADEFGAKGAVERLNLVDQLMSSGIRTMEAVIQELGVKYSGYFQGFSLTVEAQAPQLRGREMLEGMLTKGIGLWINDRHLFQQKHPAASEFFARTVSAAG